MSNLSLAQVAEFEKRGYITLPAAFNRDELDILRSEAERILHLVIGSSVVTGEWNARMDLTERDGRIEFRKLQPVNDLSDPIRRASEDERLVGPLRQLMGAEPVLMEEKLNYKQSLECPELLEKFHPRSGDDRFPLHHDWGYYRANGYPREIISSAICIDECTPDNGPIRVIAGSHLHEYPLKEVSASSGNGEVVDAGFTEADRVDIAAPAGSIFLFHSMLLHDSKPNLTGRPRRIMIYSHYPATYCFLEDARNGRGRSEGQKVEARMAAILSAADTA